MSVQIFLKGILVVFCNIYVLLKAFVYYAVEFKSNIDLNYVCEYIRGQSMFDIFIYYLFDCRLNYNINADDERSL